MISFNLMNLFFLSKIHITIDWMRDTRTIFRPIRILIQIYGWDKIIWWPNRNRVYGVSNTTPKNLRTTHSVSTFGCLQSVSSTQTPEFEAVLDQLEYDQTAHLNKKIWTTHYEIWRILLSGNENEITHVQWRREGGRQGLGPLQENAPPL